MTFDFSEKMAVITGGASGTGQASSEKLALCGAQTIIADIHIDNAQKIAQNTGASAKAVHLDVSEEASWQELFEGSGKIDYLVNAAGIGIAGNFEDFPGDCWGAVFAINLKGIFLGCKHAIRTMRKTKTPGSIVNISSIGGLISTADLAAYNASKAGVTSLTKSVALHGASENLNIRCNAIHPTVVDSPMLDPLVDAFNSREQMLAQMAAGIPSERVVTTDEVASAILFLLSDMASMINGSGLPIDGAQLAGISQAPSPLKN